METKYIITDINNKIFCAIYNTEDNNCHYLRLMDSGNIVGNVYAGRVENVVKNINAAFIEIADKQKCYYSIEDNKHPLFLNNKNNSSVNQGDKILVQVTNEPIKTKPAKVSSKIELTGNYAVISSDVSGVHLSRKLKSSENFQIIIDAAVSLLADKKAEAQKQTKYQSICSFGIIIRSSCANADKDDVISEINTLCDKYINMLKRAVFSQLSTLLHSERPSYINDIIHLSGSDNVEVITDVPDIYNELTKHLGNNSNIHIRIYEDSLLPLYKLYSVEKEIETALSRKVWLKSGGYLIIEQTEALTVIDVNSGKTVSKAKNAEAVEQSALKTNLEAADKLMQQLKTRNISGIIIVDFININKESSEILMKHLKSLAKRDIVNTTVVDMTPLGLVEITRKKNGKSLSETMNVM